MPCEQMEIGAAINDLKRRIHVPQTIQGAVLLGAGVEQSAITHECPKCLIEVLRHRTIRQRTVQKISRMSQNSPLIAWKRRWRQPRGGASIATTRDSEHPYKLSRATSFAYLRFFSFVVTRIHRLPFLKRACHFALPSRRDNTIAPSSNVTERGDSFGIRAFYQRTGVARRYKQRLR